MFFNDKIFYMDNSPLISIIVPVFNTEKYLEQCLNSLINQTYNNIEIILVFRFIYLYSTSFLIHLLNCTKKPSHSLGYYHGAWQTWHLCQNGIVGGEKGGLEFSEMVTF